MSEDLSDTFSVSPSLSSDALREHVGKLPAEREPGIKREPCNAERTKRCRHGAAEAACCTKRSKSSGCSLVSATRSGGGAGAPGVAGVAGTAGMGEAGEAGVAGTVGALTRTTGRAQGSEGPCGSRLGCGKSGERWRAPMGEGCGEETEEGMGEGGGEGWGGKALKRQLSEVESSSSEIPSSDVESSPRDSGPAHSRAWPGAMAGALARRRMRCSFCAPGGAPAAAVAAAAEAAAANA